MTRFTALVLALLLATPATQAQDHLFSHVIRDIDEANEAYEDAGFYSAYLGERDPDAAMQLGLGHYRGTDGLEVDWTYGRYLVGVSAANGNLEARVLLIYMYRDGLGTLKNPIQAHVVANAASARVPCARKLREEIGAGLSPVSLKEAYEKAFQARNLISDRPPRTNVHDLCSRMEQAALELFGDANQ